MAITWVENYWSDYAGVDDDRDEIGNTSYIIDNENQDNSPLMQVVQMRARPQTASKWNQYS